VRSRADCCSRDLVVTAHSQYFARSDGRRSGQDLPNAAAGCGSFCQDSLPAHDEIPMAPAGTPGSCSQPNHPCARGILAIPAGSLSPVPAWLGRRPPILVAHESNTRKSVSNEALAGGNANQHDVAGRGEVAVREVAERRLAPPIPAFHLLNVRWNGHDGLGCREPLGTGSGPWRTMRPASVGSPPGSRIPDDEPDHGLRTEQRLQPTPRRGREGAARLNLTLGF